jgi:hypothetical protein
MPGKNDKITFEGCEPSMLFREFAAEWDTVMIALAIGSTALFCFWARIRATGDDG